MEFHVFDSIKIGLASPEQIREWSYGEVEKPETINYRTLKPERDGLFCERIFGPTKDWECHCGKYKRLRYQGKICDKCGVEVTRKKVRRERMGHIELAAPVSHIWYFKGIPSRMGLVLDMSPRLLEKIIYFASYVVIDPGQNTGLEKKQLLSDKEYREYRDKYEDEFVAGIGAEAVKKLLQDLDLDKISEELKEELETANGQKRVRLLKRLEAVEAFRLSHNKPEWMILDVVPVIPPELRPMVQLDGGRFATSDLNDLYRRVINRNNRLKRLLELGAPDIIVRNEKRMLQEAVDALIDNGRRGRPVTGPNNRPLKSLSDMLKGKQGRFRQNLLGKRVDYSGRSVIVVGPELKMYQCGLPKEMALELFKPFVMKRLVETGAAGNIKSARKMVERAKTEVWDALETVIKDHPVMLNRAPTLHRLGIQAFEPILVEGRAIKLHPLVCTAFNADFDGDQMAVHVPLSAEAQAEARFLMLAANNLLKPSDGRPVSVPTQDMVLGSYYLTLRQRDTKDILPEERLTNIDREAGTPHLPLIREVEARDDLGDEELGKTIACRILLAYLDRCRPEMEQQDRLAFCRTHALVAEDGSEWKSEKQNLAYLDGLCYRNPEEALMAYHEGAVGLHVPVQVRVTGTVNGVSRTKRIHCTIGQMIFNTPIPQDLGFVDRSDPDKCLDLEITFKVGKKQLGKIIDACIKTHGTAETSEVLDNIKTQGFKYSTRGAITVAVSDAVIPPKKKQLLEDAEKRIDNITKQFRRGLISNKERSSMVIDTWDKTTKLVSDALTENLDEYNPIFMMGDSGARGSINNFRQLAGMRGLIANTSGTTIEIPIRANYREGLNILEYFISSRGARKGLADTALRTADSGYLTRRLVDVSQDVIIRQEDCGTHEGIVVCDIKDGNELIESMQERLVGRYPADDVYHPETGELLADRHHMMNDDDAKRIVDAGITRLKIRSILNCHSEHGVCAYCYGANLANGQDVAIGEAVGIIAAQSIGEPGTQLTMRTFHTGGIASAEDITQGLPRVEELFEARKPKHLAIISEIPGKVRIDEVKKNKHVFVTDEENGEARDYLIPYGSRIRVSDGDVIEAGDMLTEGSVNPHDILAIKGVLAVQDYLIQEVQHVYRMQGVDINDKHIEVIVRQMLRKVRVDEAGDTKLLPGALVDKGDILRENEEIARRMAVEGAELREATYIPVLLGITKASLATDSFLSAASFQETTRVLTEAAINGKVDPLMGLKENVIIGKLVPAGTGVADYGNVSIVPAEEVLTKAE